jgi:hypothetical protein
MRAVDNGTIFEDQSLFDSSLQQNRAPKDENAEELLVNQVKALKQQL